MMLSNITIPMLGIVDTAVMGHMGASYYLGAVAVGVIIFNFLFWGFGFLRMGTVGMTAQANGRADGDELRAILGRSFLLVAIIAAFLLTLQKPVSILAFHLVDASLEIEQFAAQYFHIRIWSAPATLLNYVLLGWFLGLQKARITMTLMIFVNCVNLVLDLYFVLGLKWEVAGLAWASVIAEYSGLVLGILFVTRTLRYYSGHWNWNLLLNGKQFRSMLALNHNIFIRTACLMFAFAFFTAQGARAGDIIVAVNAVLLNFQTFMAYALDGFAHAAEVLVGTAVGTRDKGRFWRSIKAAGVWSVAVALLFVTVYALFGNNIIALLTNLEQVRQYASYYLPWLIFMPLVAVWSYLLDGIFIGATRAREMRNVMLLSVFLVYLPVWYTTQTWGNHGLWFAMLSFLAARSVFMGWNLYRMERLGVLFTHGALESA